MSNRKTIYLAKKYSIIKSALGIHPVDAITEKNVDEEIEFISKQKNIVAIGEIGLDLYHNTSLDIQKKVFEKLISVAEKRNLPVIVHSRKAEIEAVSMLKSSKLKKIVMHCFTGNLKLARIIEDNGWYFSIPSSIVRSSHFQQLVKQTSMKYLLTETDSPYQSPYKDKINQPSYVSLSVEEIAKLKNLDHDETKKIIFMNYKKIFVT